MNRDVILVTGINGFVGRHMALWAASHGKQVVGVGRRPSLAWQWRDIDYVQRDLTDVDGVVALLAKVAPTAIVHLAGAVDAGQSWQAPRQFIEANVIATGNLLEAVRVLGPGAVKRIVVVGSSHEYQASHGIHGCRLDEAAPTQPENPYGWSKRLQSTLVAMYASSFALPIVVARTFNLMGPAAKRGVVAHLAQQVAAMEAGIGGMCLHVENLRVRRDFLDVRDAVAAYGHLLVADDIPPGDIFNVCSGRATSIARLVALLQKQARLSFAVAVSIANGQRVGPAVICGSNRKLRAQTGWQPQIELAQSLADTLAYWRQRTHGNNAANREGVEPCV